MRRVCTFLKRFAANEDGGPLIEFVLVAAFIGLSLPAFFDLAKLIDTKLAISNGMNAGLHYAQQNPDDEAGIEQVIEQASGLAADVETSTVCECGAVSTACGGTCPSAVMERYRRIDISHNIAGLSLYGELYAGSALTKTAYVRIE